MFGCFDGVWQGPWGCFGARVGLEARGVSFGFGSHFRSRSTAQRGELGVR